MVPIDGVTIVKYPVIDRVKLGKPQSIAVDSGNKTRFVER